METLRIVMLSDWFLPRVGGVEVSIDELSRGLSREGHEVFVVSHSYRVNNVMPELELREGFYVYRVRTGLLARDDVTYDPLAVAKAALFIKRNAVDVVHAHGLSSTLSLLGSMIASGGTGVPVVLTNHSLIGSSLNPLARTLLRYALKWPAELTGVSRAAALDISRVSGRPAEVVPNCIDIKRWRSLAKSNDEVPVDGDPSIIITSRLSPRKNPLEIAAVARLVVKELPRAVFYVIGDGSLARDLRETLGREGLDGRVRMLGIMPRERLPGILASADMFVLTSYRESFGISVLEAMALGVPVVVYSSPGVLDLVDHMVNGAIVNGPEEMARMIVRLSSDEALRRRLSQEAALKAVQFDCRAVVPRYLDVYRRSMQDKCCVSDRRFLAYRLFRLLVGDPVKKGEWCFDRKLRYNERASRSKKGAVPVFRRGAGRAALLCN